MKSPASPLLPAFCLLLLSCSSSLYLPEGNAADGRQAFLELGCHTCHRVEGQGFPDPVAMPPVPVALGTTEGKRSRQYLAESIIAPSHRFARPRPSPAGDPPQLVSWAEYANIRTGDMSRMGDYNEVLTVKQWLDLVAFLEAVQEE